MRLSGMNALLILLSLLIAGCSSDPEARDPYNSADEQRSRASEAQDELSRETSDK
jgi:PBP1b-binding outer membrane lipoprotein LpoB